MSSEGPGPSRRRRKYVAKACNNCRRRRCKCDGVQPTCGTCASSGHECLWGIEDDTRRPATKQLVESLRTKIQVLEVEIARLRGLESSEGGVTPPLDPTPLFVQGSSKAHHHPSPGVSSSTDGRLVSESAAQHDPTATRSQSAHSGSSLEAQFPATEMYKYIFEIDPLIAPNEQPTDANRSLTCDWSRHLPELGNVQLTREEHDAILSRCFKYGMSWLFGLIPEIFLHDMLFSLSNAPSDLFNSPKDTGNQEVQPRLQHYSPMLHCAILAFASAFSDDAEIRSRAIRDAFADQAKSWLEDEIRKPVMSLVRSLALLAEYHCGLGERASGYMYMGEFISVLAFLVVLRFRGGMSIRAARAIISVGQQGSWANPGTSENHQLTVREWHFWSAFAQDKIMCFEYQQYSDFAAPQSDINMPSIDHELDNHPWPASAAEQTDADSNQPKLTSLAFFETCKLLIIGTRVIGLLKTGPEQEQLGRMHTATLNLQYDLYLRLGYGFYILGSSFCVQFETWFNNLPESILVWTRSTHTLPHVLVLHICYWWLLICLHQPLYLRGLKSGPSQSNQSLYLSVKMCDRAVHKVVQLLNMFDARYGLRFFPRSMIQAISTCGHALLLQRNSAPSGATKKRATALNDMQVCVRALRMVSTVWPGAEVYADDLEVKLDEQRYSEDAESEDASMADPVEDDPDETMAAHED